MNEIELITHIKGFNNGRGRYGFEVEYEKAYAGVTLKDRDLGFRLAEMASRVGQAKYIKLIYFNPKRHSQDPPEILIDYPVVPGLWSPRPANVIDLQNQKAPWPACE